MADQPGSPDIGRRYWRKTSQLMWIVLVLWACLGLGVHLFASDLNRVVLFGFPLGYFMAAQGSLIGFVVLIFWYARRQNRIDEDFNLAED
jgi:putative solute:sodium symporter small subunit